MLRNYVHVALRNLIKHKGYTLITAIGLAVGLACCLLILMLVRHEWSYDTFHMERDRIYRVLIRERRPDGSVEYRSLTQPSLAPAMAREFPVVERYTRIVGGELSIRQENQVFRETVFMADSAFFDIFTFPLLVGDAHTALKHPQSMVITEAMARKYFGQYGSAYERVLGRTLAVESGDERHDFTITGVMAPIPSHSGLQFDILIPFERYPGIYVGANDWGARASLYLLLKRGQGAPELERALAPFTRIQLADHIQDRRGAGLLAEGEGAFQLALQPLRRVHLEPEKPVTYEQPVHNPLYSYILAGVGLLVLGIACINFVTLSVGRSTARAREVGVRKVLGAHRIQLMRQFWGEALLLTVVSLVLSLVLVELALPTFNRLTGQHLAVGQFRDWPGLLALLALIGVVALGAGSYPAAVLSRFQPATVLKASAQGSRNSRFTSSLVVVQYAVSIALIICTLVMYRQFKYLLEKDLGFDTEQIVVVHTPDLSRAMERGVLDRFRTKAAAHDWVVNVVKTGWAFTHSYDTYGWNTPDGTNISVHMIGADYDYLNVMGMELAAGRNFSRDFPTDSTHSVLVNEAFVRTYDIRDPIGYTLVGVDGFFGDVDPTIIGVVEDFNFRPLHEEVQPAMLNMHPDYYMGMQAMLVKIRPEDVSGSIAVLERTWKEVFPEKPFAYSFMSEDIAAQYQSERRWSHILTDSALLAVLIACMGLFGLATLSVQKRTKEIGIRKVLGASVAGIAMLIAREFAMLMGIATVVACPVAYVAMRRWLDDFAYHTSIPWWIFVVAGLSALMLALLTVSYHSIRAATADPVKALRYE